jgi:Pyruvate/2-oxoacid:ferredoxin oxidoreductase delta subunit
MVRRKIIKIDETLCNGCGNCIVACAEGAIRLVDGKARVVSDRFCDGLGACIGECPVGALTMEERETEEFDEKAAKAHLNLENSVQLREMMKVKRDEKQELLPMAPCSVSFGKSPKTAPQTGHGTESGRHMRKLGASSQLYSWPIQMRLAHANAPYFQGASLLIAADCTAFACPSISEFIKGRRVLIGCPKLDETGPFLAKLAEILTINDVKDIAILYMEVPCCSHLVRAVLDAVKKSGKKIPVSEHICMIDGQVTVKDKPV